MSFLGNKSLREFTVSVEYPLLATCAGTKGLGTTGLLLSALRVFINKYSLRCISVTVISLGIGLEAQAVEPPRWKSLNYVTSILFFSAESHLEITDVEPSSVFPKIEKSSYGKSVLTPAKKVKHLVLTSSFLGKHSHISLYFDPNLNTFQRTQLNSGKKNRYKAYYFLDSGVYSFSQNPAEGEQTLAYSDWSNKGDAYFQYPAELDLKKPIIDSTNLFYIMSSELFTQPGDKASFNVFVKNRLLTLDIIAEELTEIEVDYFQVLDGHKEYIEQDVEVLRIAVYPKIYNAMQTNSAAQLREFKFLGLKGNLQFYVETNKRLLVQLSGKVDVVGVVDIVLNKVEFK